MMWQDFINSSYNTNDVFTLSSDNEVLHNNTTITSKYASNKVFGTDLISKDTPYKEQVF